MLLIPVRTGILKQGMDLSKILRERAEIESGDIVVISSKAVATIEGAMVDLLEMQAGKEAKHWSEKCGKPAHFCEAVLRETARLHGRVVGSCAGALLTELKPSGMKQGGLVVPNAGLDESNIGRNFAIGWPHDPVGSLQRLRAELGDAIGFVISDSCCLPRRVGVTAFALAVAGVEPLKNEIGNLDLHQKKLVMTVEATADQLATAANFVMGNAAQGIPVVIVRDHGLTITDVCEWVSGIDPDADLFRDLFCEPKQ